MQAFVEAFEEVTSIEALWEISSVEPLVKVTSMEALIQVTSMEAFVEVSSVGAFIEVFVKVTHEFFRGRFRGSFQKIIGGILREINCHGIFHISFRG